MRQIRNNLFETNSSSVHAISISKNPYNLPNYSLTFCFGQYGWSAPTLDTVNERLSYLYTYIYSFCTFETTQKYMTKLLDWFKEDNIAYTFRHFPLWHPHSSDRCSYFETPINDWEEGYVDHQSLNEETLVKLFSSKDIMYHYLFSDDSAVCIHNDNSSLEKLEDFVQNYNRDTIIFCDGYDE